MPDPIEPIPLTPVGLPQAAVTDETKLHWRSLPTWNGFIGRACVPIYPAAALPEYWVGGIKAQVEGCARNADGNWNVVEVIAPVRNSSNEWALETSGTIDPAASLNSEAWLEDLKLVLRPFGKAVNFEAPVVSPTSTTIKSGKYLETKKYFSRFSGTLGDTDKVLAYHGFLTRTSDKRIYLLDIRITNGNTTAADQGGGDFDQDGEVYFDYLRMTGLPAGWSLVCDVPRPCMELDVAEPEIVKQLGANQWNYIPPCSGFVFRFAICQDAEVPQALSLLRRAQWAYADGYDSFYRRRAFGEQQTLLFTPTADVTYEGFTGRDALDRHFQDHFDNLRNLFGTGTTSSTYGVWNTPNGWSQPIGLAQGRAPSGGWKHVATGWANTPSEWNWSSLALDSQHPRHQKWQTDPVTGEFQTIHNYAAANGGVLPESSWWGYEFRDVLPSHLEHPDAVEDDGKVPVPSLPTNKVWNALTGAATCPYDFYYIDDADPGDPPELREAGLKYWLVGGSSAKYIYRHWDAAHILRAIPFARVLAWQTNDPVAKDWLEMISGDLEFATSSIPVSPYNRSTTLGVPASQALVPGNDLGKYADLPKYQAMLDADPANEHLCGRFDRDPGEALMVHGANYYLGTTDRRTKLKPLITYFIDIYYKERLTNGLNERGIGGGAHFEGPESSAPYTYDLRGIMAGGQTYEHERGLLGMWSAGLAAHGSPLDTRWAKLTEIIEDGERAIHDTYPDTEANHHLPYCFSSCFILHVWGNPTSGSGSTGLTHYPVGAIVSHGGNRYRCNTFHAYDGSAASAPGGASGYWTLDNTIGSFEVKADGAYVPPTETYPDWMGFPSFTETRSATVLSKLWRITGDPRWLQKCLQAANLGLGTGTYENAIQVLLADLSNDMGSGNPNVSEYTFQRYADTVAELQYALEATPTGFIVAAGAGAQTSMTGAVTRTGSIVASGAGATASLTGHGDVLSGTIRAAGGGATASLTGAAKATGTLTAVGGGAEAALTGVVNALTFNPSELEVVQVEYAGVSSDLEVTVTYG